jgi:Rieske 2Fe-2S family protein
MPDAAESAPSGTEWDGLRRIEPTLPSEQYYAAEHFQRELQKIWYRQWVYLCRAETLPAPLDYRTFQIGTQPILVLRDEAGQLQGFFNTCRHRGSLLCSQAQGHLAAKALTCPYHSWSYDLRGRLARIPNYGRAHLIEPGDVSLYPIALREWKGFVFANLEAQAPPAFETALDDGIDAMAHWPLGELVVGHTQTWMLQCNWKVFWENYNECLHCPNVHPALTKLVPIYGRGIMRERDDPRWREHESSTDPKFKGGLRTGAESWSSDGTAGRYRFAALTAEERRAGYHFVTALPSLYIVGHVDYVRAVRLRPVAPEQTELQAEWLFAREALADPAFDLRNSVEFVARVIAEDGAACELAQRGLHAAPYRSGVLLPEEYEVHAFHNWLRRELKRD